MFRPASRLRPQTLPTGQPTCAGRSSSSFGETHSPGKVSLNKVLPFFVVFLVFLQQEAKT
jgi:hypothetical protein